MVISILLPSYNNKCYTLAAELQRQCEEVCCGGYEIIVADDGSRDQVNIIHNLRINELPNCRYIRRKENVGRAAIRNVLASEAKGNWLLFLDSDVEIVRKDFVASYINSIAENNNGNETLHHDDMNHAEVIYGGVTVCGQAMPHNLRYIYEKTAEPMHTAEKRNMSPYSNFHTANFMISSSVFARIRFDERVKQYGYEDILFGKNLKKSKVGILHIDNPVGLGKWESNAEYMRKVDMSLHTLHEFEDELRGYSTLLHAYDKLHSLHLTPLLQLWHHIFHHIELHNLTGNNPSLTVLKMYKLGKLTVFLNS